MNITVKSAILAGFLLIMLAACGGEEQDRRLLTPWIQAEPLSLTSKCMTNSGNNNDRMI